MSPEEEAEEEAEAALRQQTLEAIKAKLKAPCPNCGSRNWQVGDVEISSVIRASRMIDMVAGIPTVPVVCETCSLVLSFAAVPLGLAASADAP